MRSLHVEMSDIRNAVYHLDTSLLELESLAALRDIVRELESLATLRDYDFIGLPAVYMGRVFPLTSIHSRPTVLLHVGILIWCYFCSKVLLKS